MRSPRDGHHGAVTPAREISTDELRRKLGGDASIVLIDALAPMVYAHSHLPGALNLPASSFDRFAVERRLPDRSAEIIVYCSNPDCDDSHATAEKLIALGYTNVWRYPGGKDEWRGRGLPLERAGKPYLPAQ
jgi:rhodanese-related sulfurtransferase